MKPTALVFLIGRRWVPVQVLTLVSLSKMFHYNCFVLRMGRKAKGPSTKGTQNPYPGRVGVNPSVSGSEHPCLHLSSYLWAALIKVTYEASLLLLPEIYNNDIKTNTDKWSLWSSGSRLIHLQSQGCGFESYQVYHWFHKYCCLVASCDANLIAPQREMERVPIVASPKLTLHSHSQEVWTGLYWITNS